MAIIRDTVKFKIEITRITTTEYETTKDVLLKEEHYTNDELQGNFSHIARRENLHEYMRKIYGTRPAIASNETKETVLELLVNEISLKDITGAILK